MHWSVNVIRQGRDADWAVGEWETLRILMKIYTPSPFTVPIFTQLAKFSVASQITDHAQPKYHPPVLTCPTWTTPSLWLGPILYNQYVSFNCAHNSTVLIY